MKKHFDYTKFYECFALQVLEHYYPAKFVRLEKSESPDFINSSVGLEVTRAIETSMREIDGLFCEYMNRSFSEIPPKQLIKLGFTEEPKPTNEKNILFVQRSITGESLLCSLEEGTNNFSLTGYTPQLVKTNSVYFSIIEAIIKKTKKLNKNYQLRSENDLVVVINQQLNAGGCGDVIIENFLSEFKLIYKDEMKKHSFNKNYDYIYMLFMDNLFVFNSKTFHIEHISVPKEIYAKTQKCVADSGLM